MKKLFVLSAAVALVGLVAARTAQAETIKLINWGVDVNNTTTDAQRQEFRDITNATASDFAFFAYSAGTVYFVNADFDNYGVKAPMPSSSNYKYVFFFHDKTKWSVLAEYKKTYTWGRGVFVAEVVEHLTTHQQYALVFCLDDFKDSQTYSTTMPALVKEITDAYPDARVLLSYNTLRIKNIIENGFENAGYALVASHDNGAVYSKSDWGLQPSSATTATMSGEVYAKTTGYLATINYPTTCRAVFKDWNGTELKSASVVQGESVEPPTPGERMGFSFEGWRVNGELVDDAFFGQVDADFEAVASYVETSTDRQVKFVDWDDTEIDTVTVAKGSPVAAIADPERTYYTFTHWTLDGAVWDFATPVVENITLKAVYVQAVTDVEIDSAEAFVTALTAGYPQAMTYHLTEDLDFADVDYTPADFRSVLNGNGHAISGLGDSVRLFNDLYGTVSNVTFRGIASASSVGANCGILATKTYGATIVDCTFEDCVRRHHTTNGGGALIAYDSYAEEGRPTVVSNCVARNCRVYSSLDSCGQQIGGFFAMARDTKMMDCVFTAPDNEDASIGATATHAGGLIGIANKNVALERCQVSGRIVALQYADYLYGGAGGLIGSIGETQEAITLTSCTNLAHVVANSANGAGGMIGRVNQAKVYLSDCRNEGHIEQVSGGTSNFAPGSGGMVGSAWTKSLVYIDGCVNYGAIDSAGQSAAGGLVAYIYGRNSYATLLSVSNSFNYGSVTSELAAGGILGRANDSGSTAFVNIGNSGSVSCATNVAGGVVGDLYLYGNTSWMKFDGVLENGAVSTETGLASPLIGALVQQRWSGIVLYLNSVILAGTATATDAAGQVGAVAGGYEPTTGVYQHQFSVDENCRVLGSYAADYYNTDNEPQSLSITPMTEAQLTTRKGAVKWLNDNADEKGYMRWVRGKTNPELAAFGEEYISGLLLIVR